MSIANLLVLHKDHELSIKTISLLLEVPESMIRKKLHGRIKPKKVKKSWLKAQQRRKQLASLFD